jgi:uncharacterized membrane protein YhaH (DUF805 family)
MFLLMLMLMLMLGLCIPATFDDNAKVMARRWKDKPLIVLQIMFS